MIRRLALTLAVLSATTAAAMAAPKPFRWDWTDVPGSLQRLQTSKDPAAARIRAQIRNGPAALAKEQKLALGDALPPPTDPFTGLPLGYRWEGDGFVVWSAGEKKAFDGGTPGSTARGESAFRYPR